MRNLLSYFRGLESSKKINIGLVLILVLILLSAVFIYNKVFVKTTKAPIFETDLPFDPGGPYAILSPRRDGDAIVLDITRVSDVDSMSYDLTYQSEGIDRGVHGDIKKSGDDKKSEYNQEILLGTCSQGFTSGGSHCVFDKNVENGTLTLHIVKGEKGYRMIIAWHLQKPDVALGVITSADGHFTYSTSASRLDLASVAYTIVNDLSGIPKLPVNKKILGKIYSLNPPINQNFPSGVVSIELADKPPSDAEIARYDFSKASWEELATKEASSAATLTASPSGAGIFAVLTNSSAK